MNKKSCSSGKGFSAFFLPILVAVFYVLLFSLYALYFHHFHAYRECEGFVLFAFSVSAMPFIVLCWLMYRRRIYGLRQSNEKLERDVTDQLNFTASLRESEERFRTLVDQAGEALFLHDMDGNIVDVNRAAVQCYGYSRQEFLQLTAQDIDPDIEIRRDPENYWETLKRDGVIHFEARHRRKDGSEFPVEVSLSAIELKGMRHIIALARDESEHQRHEHELCRLNERFRLAQQAAGFGIWELNPSTQDVIWDDVMCSIYGVESGQFSSNYEAWKACVHPEDKKRVEALVATALADERKLDAEFRIIRPDGDTRTISASATVLRNASGEAERMIGINIDITENRRLEDERQHMEVQLRQSQKLESIGTLAGGVAHEINNPVSGIMNYAQLIKDRLGEGHEELHEFATEIINESRRIGGLTKGLLNFAQQDKGSHGPAQLTDIVENTLSLVRTVMRNDGIQLEVFVSDELPQVICHSQQIQQVVMNLLTNARDALNAKYPAGHEDKIIRMTALEHEIDHSNCVRLTVEDHGQGICEVEKDVVFDPFYTTKRPGRGVGLGLSISHSIVKDHGGWLSVESKPGEWTRFHMDLPTAEICRNGVGRISL